MISLVVAVSTNNVIGSEGDLPWRLSADLKHFKALTMGKPIVMGRRTWESIGRALPGRQNIVITRQADYVADGADVVTSPAAALRAAGDAAEIMVIGGGEIYALFLDKAERLYRTLVETSLGGDTYFPEIDKDDWQLISSDAHAADADNDFAVLFQTFARGCLATSNSD